MKKDLEKEVKSIGEYLGCNENELWSEMKKLIDSCDKALIETIKNWAEKEKKDLPKSIDLVVDAIGASNAIRNQGFNQALSALLTYLNSL